jgi:hypothetical protein
MAMQDWIHRYPQVERLLQRGPDEELCYDADTAEVRTPLLGRQIVALGDEEYRRQVRLDASVYHASVIPWPLVDPEESA